MAGSVNRVILIGNLGTDPEIRNMQSGDKVANFSLATSESWKDKSGERQERTQWHKIVIFNQGIVGVVEKFVKKGSKVYLEGQLETRQWEKDGVKQYTTEIVLKPFRGELTMLSSKDDGAEQSSTQSSGQRSTQPRAQAQPVDDFDDTIPF